MIFIQPLFHLMRAFYFPSHIDNNTLNIISLNFPLIFKNFCVVILYVSNGSKKYRSIIYFCLRSLKVNLHFTRQFE